MKIVAIISTIFFIISCGVKSPPLPPLKEGVQKGELREAPQKSPEKEKKRKSKYK